MSFQKGILALSLSLVTFSGVFASHSGDGISLNFNLNEDSNGGTTVNWTNLTRTTGNNGHTELDPRSALQTILILNGVTEEVLNDLEENINRRDVAAVTEKLTQIFVYLQAQSNNNNSNFPMELAALISIILGGNRTDDQDSSAIGKVNKNSNRIYYNGEWYEHNSWDADGVYYGEMSGQPLPRGAGLNVHLARFMGTQAGNWGTGGLSNLTAVAAGTGTLGGNDRDAQVGAIASALAILLCRTQSNNQVTVSLSGFGGSSNGDLS